jgi:CHAD domain-containing protein
MKRGRTLGKFLARNLRKRLDDVLEEAPPALARGRELELHALRIAVKRLRYGLEWTVPLAPASPAALELVAELQRKLGAFVDACAFQATYARLLGALSAGDARRAGIEALRAAPAANRERALDAVRALWAGTPGAPYPERLAASISAAVGSLSPKDES